jgi:hypothetical protein
VPRGGFFSAFYALYAFYAINEFYAFYASGAQWRLDNRWLMIGITERGKKSEGRAGADGCLPRRRAPIRLRPTSARQADAPYETWIVHALGKEVPARLFTLLRPGTAAVQGRGLRDCRVGNDTLWNEPGRVAVSPTGSKSVKPNCGTGPSKSDQIRPNPSKPVECATASGRLRTTWKYGRRHGSYDIYANVR